MIINNYYVMTSENYVLKCSFDNDDYLELLEIVISYCFFYFMKIKRVNVGFSISLLKENFLFLPLKPILEVVYFSKLVILAKNKIH